MFLGVRTSTSATPSMPPPHASSGIPLPRPTCRAEPGRGGSGIFRAGQGGGHEVVGDVWDRPKR